VLDTDDYVENVNKIWNTGWKPVLHSDEDDTGSDTDVATESESEEEDYTEKFNRYVKFVDFLDLSLFGIQYFSDKNAN